MPVFLRKTGISVSQGETDMKKKIFMMFSKRQHIPVFQRKTGISKKIQTPRRSRGGPLGIKIFPLRGKNFIRCFVFDKTLKKIFLKENFPEKNQRFFVP